MIIPEELAQKIVDSAMCMVHRNVNIMNRDGIIIATGHSHRQSTFHKGALDVIESGSVIEIFPDELSLYPGALQGVNLPVMLDDQIVGVVGVFGHPDEVRETGRLVKMITELLLERDLMQREKRSKTRLREEFMEAAVTNQAAETTPKLRRISKALSLNLNLPRVAVVVDVSSLLSRFTSEYGPSELVAEQAEESIVQSIAGGGLTADEDVAAVLDDKLVVMKTSRGLAGWNDILSWIESAKQLLPLAGGISLPAGAGTAAKTVSEYHASYRQALFALAHCQADRPTRSINDRSLLVRYFAREALNASTISALGDLRLRFVEALREHPDMKNTLETLLDSNMDINAAAARLHIHRNTLLYRLSRIQAEIGLDPVHSTDDLILCRLLLGLY